MRNGNIYKEKTVALDHLVSKNNILIIWLFESKTEKTPRRYKTKLNISDASSPDQRALNKVNSIYISTWSSVLYVGCSNSSLKCEKHWLWPLVNYWIVITHFMPAHLFFLIS